MERGTFIMDGVNSSTIHAYIQDRPLLETPLRKVEWESSYGVDGDTPFDEEAYDNTSLDLILMTNGSDLIRDRQNLVNMLDGRGSYKEFIPYFDPDKIYRVMMNEKSEFENKHYYGNAQAMSAKFTVKPYKYLINSGEQVFTTKTFSLNNPTYYVSQPLIKLEGSGDVVITINEIEFQIRDMVDHIVLDSERYLAYTEGPTGPITSQNSKIYTREYPILRPEDNDIVISGDVSRVDFNPR